MILWKRKIRKKKHRAQEGKCYQCGHVWQEHMREDDSFSCGECEYEIEHGEPDAPNEPCVLRPPEGFLRYPGE